MGYEMGFSICKKGEGDFDKREVVCLNSWCSSGQAIYDYVAEILHQFKDDYIVLTGQELMIITAKLDAAYSGSDIIGTETMKYLLDGTFADLDDADERNYIVTKAKGIHANVSSVLLAVSNFYWGAGEMDYGTFIRFREFMKGIVYMTIQEDYELIMWRSY